MSDGRPALERWLHVAAPATVLALGRRASRVVAAAVRSGQSPTGAPRLDLFEWPSPCDGPSRGRLLDAMAASSLRYELAYVSLEDDAPDHGCAEPLLAHLRDVRASLVWVTQASAARRPALTREDITALGFVAGPALGRESGVALYVYDVATYKRTPAWLNPNGWAHPELWDKHRW